MLPRRIQPPRYYAIPRHDAAAASRDTRVFAAMPLLYASRYDADTDVTPLR